MKNFIIDWMNECTLYLTRVWLLADPERKGRRSRRLSDQLQETEEVPAVRTVDWTMVERSDHLDSLFSPKQTGFALPSMRMYVFMCMYVCKYVSK